MICHECTQQMNKLGQVKVFSEKEWVLYSVDRMICSNGHKTRVPSAQNNVDVITGKSSKELPNYKPIQIVRESVIINLDELMDNAEFIVYES